MTYTTDDKTNKKWLWWLLGIAAFLLTFGLGIFAGTVYDVRRQIVGKAGTVDVAKVIDLYSQSRSDQVSFDQFWQVWNKIKEKYVDQPVSDVSLFYGAIEGMVTGLKDPHSVYFPPKDAEEFAKDLSGEFEGIGAEIGIKNSQLIVVAPLPASPAEKAGLKPGDKIFAIDGEDTAGMALDKAVAKIRGQRGTSVKLTVSHNGFDSVTEVAIVRETITVPTVTWRMEDKERNVAYMRISYFNQDTWAAFDKTVREMLKESPRGLILDLRSNPGGFLETSIDVASEWVKQGIIVRERLTGGESKEHRTRGAHRLGGMPTMVLIDEGTASGSEIVAGALQDFKLATLIGKKSFGKGSVQDFEVLPDGSALKLTIAKWFTPNDRAIDKEGILPDVLIEEMFAAVKPDGGETSTSTEPSPPVDKGIEKALELLRKK